MLHLIFLALFPVPMVVGQTTTTTESSLLDPQYYNIAPCPCDLQASVCDIGCCCDATCTANDKLLFDCVQGSYGGNTTVELYRRCSSTDRDNPDYHPFTCVLIEDYNAYLGLYYPVQTAVRDTSSWETKQQTASTDALLHLFPSHSVLGLSEASSESKQRKGLLVLQVPSSKPTVDNSLLGNYRLALPRRTLSGGCDRTAGVVYLEDSTSACDVTVTSDLCQSGVASSVDVISYATECNSSSSATCLAQVQTRDGTFVPVSVTYRTLSTAVGYQKGLTGSSTEGSGARQSPVVSGANCTNAVVDVKYSFVWSGSTIVRLDATVKLAPVTIGSVVSQRFAASFTHLLASASSVKRPGVIGYEPESWLLGGALSGSTVNMSSTFWPRLMKSNSAGFCDASQAGDPVLFLMDSTSYCTESFPFSDFGNCNGLRERFRAKLRAQFPTHNFVLGIFGAADPTVLADWVSVQDRCPANSRYAGSNNLNLNLNGVCTQVPNHILLTVLYAEQGKANDISIWQVVGAYFCYYNTDITCRSSTCSATLATRVRFVRVSPSWLDGAPASFGPSKTPCWWGICWEDMFYPLTREFDGESRTACVAWLAFICFVLLLALYISRPF